MVSTQKALVIIDVQNDYFKGGNMELYKAEEASSNIQLVLEHFRKNNLPVVHVQHFNIAKGATFFVPNTKGSEIHDSVKPKENETLVTKNYPNSFRETKLHEILQNLKVTDLVIVGSMSHMCIDTSVRAAADLGYNCTVLHDACATRDLEFNGKVVKAEDVQVAYMSALQFGFAKVISTQEYLK